MDWSPEAQATLWGAGAALVTGLVAVGGAIYVGLRQADIQSKQAGIAERQTKILDRQTALAELTLRHELFEKRQAIYEATSNLLVRAIQNGGWVAYTDSFRTDFIVGMEKAKFLFRPSVKDDLQEIWEKVNEGTMVHEEMQALYQREQHYGPDFPRRSYEISIWIGERLAKLSDLFGNELKLSDHDMQLG